MARDATTTDFLVAGGGAVAMAFVDTLLDETDGEIVMVDRHDHPGGHWNDAYPFVRLHQPSAFYGVCSRDLGQNRRETAGPNAGFYERASRDEILDHYDQVMRQRFLASGRVRWMPLSEHSIDQGGSHRVTSLLTGAAVEVAVRRKFVNATHGRTEVPSTHGPRYGVADGVEHIAVNGLPRVRRAHPRYTVVGAGKTGMDACLWMLGNGVAPERIRWIVPRDPWISNRAQIQPFADSFEETTTRTIQVFQSIIDAESTDHLFELLEARDAMMRLDPGVAPSTYHGALLSHAELDELRRIGDVVRLGRVTMIEPDRVVLERGSVRADPDTLYVHCSTSALQPSPDLPVFDGSTVNLLWVQFNQPVFSAAMIAFVEARFQDEAEKNALCRPVPVPLLPSDWPRMWLMTLENGRERQQRPEVMDWLSHCRLYAPTMFQRGLDPDDPRRKTLLATAAAKATEALAKLPALIAEAA